MQHSAVDFFTWRATTGTPTPRSTPNASTSTCEAAAATTRLRLFQRSDASHARVASSPFLAAPTWTLAPVWNSASNSPAPLLQITSWLWAWQALAVRQASKNNASAAAPQRNRTGVLRPRSDGRPEEFSGVVLLARGWQIFAIVSNHWLASAKKIITQKIYPGRMGKGCQNPAFRMIHTET